MNILLTNDDGYNAIGIKLLKKKLEKYGRVIILAPDRSRSACSTSITLGKPLKIIEVAKDIYMSDGTPADCTMLGLKELNINFDLVVSGCNDGWNLSFDANYSGTIGACLMALVNKTPSIAFSSQDGFKEVDDHFDEVLNFILKNNLLSTEYILNVNFPSKKFNGIKIAHVYYRNDFYYFEKVEEGYIPLRKMQSDFNDDVESDCYLIDHGYVSIAPLAKTNYNDIYFQELMNKIK